MAEGLPGHPEWMDVARSNLARWRELHRGDRGYLTVLDEWDAILELPVGELLVLLCDAGERGQRLRPSSPFTGVLTAKEVWALKERVRAEYRNVRPSDVGAGK